MAACVTALSVAASASPAGAAVTIGQVAPPNPPVTCNLNSRQAAQPSYVVPATNGIVSWRVISYSTSATAGTGQMFKLKIWRPVGGPTYTVVGVDGPHALSGGVLNTFTGISLPASPGDVLGLHVNSNVADSACSFAFPGDSMPQSLGDSPVGGSTTFTAMQSDRRANISAVITPTNTFTLGAVVRNKKKGTATLTVEGLPNPGELVLSGNGVKTAGSGSAVTAKIITAPGDAALTIRAKGKKKRKLNENGKVKLNPTITYTPTGGDPTTQSTKVKLRKRLQ